MTRTLAAALTALALTGCAGMAADTCRSFGYEPGSDGFLKCAQHEMKEMRAEYRHMVDQAVDRLTNPNGNSQSEPSDQAQAEE